MKLASTTALYERMADDMDLDCGPVIDGAASVEEMGQRIFEQLLRHASGEKTKASSRAWARTNLCRGPSACSPEQRPDDTQGSTHV